MGAFKEELEQLREQRRKLAASVRKRETIRQAADRLGVTYGRLYQACKEFGVITPAGGSQRGGVSRTYRILALLINTAKRQDEIAAEIGVSVARVNQVATTAREAGIRLHPKRALSDWAGETAAKRRPRKKEPRR